MIWTLTLLHVDAVLFTGSSSIEQPRVPADGKNDVMISDFYDNTGVGRYGAASVSAQVGVFGVRSCERSCE